jgi:hypothetical protein
MHLVADPEGEHVKQLVLEEGGQATLALKPVQ